MVKQLDSSINARHSSHQVMANRTHMNTHCTALHCSALPLQYHCTVQARDNKVQGLRHHSLTLAHSHHMQCTLVPACMTATSSVTAAVLTSAAIARDRQNLCTLSAPSPIRRPHGTLRLKLGVQTSSPPTSSSLQLFPSPTVASASLSTPSPLPFVSPSPSPSPSPSLGYSACAMLRTVFGVVRQQPPRKEAPALTHS